MSYSNNPFAVLDQEEEPVVEKVEQKKVAPQKAALVQKDVKTVSNGKQQNVKSTNVAQNVTQNANLSGNPKMGGDRKNNNNNTHRNKHGQSKHGKQGGGSGEGRGREFDRHSGSYRDTEKRAEKGWGDVLESGEEAVKNVDNVVEKADEQEQGAKQPEVQLVTFEEYLAEKKKQASVTNSASPPRKANEGVDESKWKNTKVFVRPDEELGLFGGGKSKASSNQKGEPKLKGREKVFVEIEQKFNALPSKSHDNYGKGQNRRNSNKKNNVGFVYDAKDFPVLT
jgi:plasminogen activator inhibitor 1 RNA-binding protein